MCGLASHLILQMAACRERCFWAKDGVPAVPRRFRFRPVSVRKPSFSTVITLGGTTCDVARALVRDDYSLKWDTRQYVSEQIRFLLSAMILTAGPPGDIAARAWQNLRSRIRLLARSSEDKMGHAGFKVPIYDRQSSQIEGGVRAHQHEQPARDHENRAVH